MGWTVGVRFPTRVRGISVLQTAFSPAPGPKGYQGYSGRVLNLTTHLNLVPSHAPTTPYVFMPWCLIKHRDRFTDDVFKDSLPVTVRAPGRVSKSQPPRRVTQHGNSRLDGSCCAVGPATLLTASTRGGSERTTPSSSSSLLFHCGRGAQCLGHVGCWMSGVLYKTTRLVTSAGTSQSFKPRIARQNLAIRTLSLQVFFFIIIGGAVLSP
jgi:hypothetical protein